MPLSGLQNIISHMIMKKPQVHFIIKTFLIENECKTPRVSYIHFQKHST